VAKAYNNWEGIEDDYGPDFDLDNRTACPRCGFGPCDIIKVPDPAGWWSSIGRARCPHCRLIFDITAADEDDDGESQP